MTNYYANTLYVDCGFSTLKTLTSGYLAHLGFYKGEDHEDNLRRFPIKWPYSWENEAGITYVAETVYAIRSHYSIIGSGIGVKLFHYRNALQGKKIHLEYIPKEIRSGLRSFPNVVEIDMHRLFFADGYIFVRDFALWLTRLGHKALMLTFDSQILNIKQNPLLSREQKFDLLSTYTLKLDSPKRISATKSLLKSRFQNSWQMLHPNTINFLKTALRFYDLVDEGVQSVCLDASPISIDLAKALENEVKYKILLPFRKYFNSHYGNLSIERDMKERELSRMVKFLSSPNITSLELGAFGYFIRIALTDTEKQQWSLVIQAFYKFAQTRINPDFFLKPNELQYNLSTIAKNYRNTAAHTDLVPFRAATEFIRILLGAEDSKIGFLSKLVQSSQPR